MVHGTYIANGTADTPPRRLQAVNAPHQEADPVEGVVVDDEATTGKLTHGNLVDPEPSRPVDEHLVEVRRERRSLPGWLDDDSPIAPTWATSGEIRRQVLQRACRRALRGSNWMLWNLPRLTLFSLGWVVRGGWRTTGRVGAWAFDRDGHPVSGAQPADSGKLYDQAEWRHSERVGFRLRLIAVLGVVALLAGVALAWLLPAVLALAAAGGVGTLAWVGRPQKIKTWTPGARRWVPPRLHAGMITRALIEVSKEKVARAIEERPDQLWGSPITPIDGGVQVQIILPGAAEAAPYCASEQRLASALGRPADCAIVIPQKHITPGHFLLRIFDTPKLSGERGPGPLVKARRTSWWENVSCGITRAGDEHTERIRGGSWFLGGQPEAGKSSLAKVSGAHTALDPNAILCIIDLKRSGGWLWARPVCHFFLDSTPEMDKTVYDKVIGFLDWLLEEATRRNDLLTRLNEQGKASTDHVTEELARRYPQLRAMTVILDEIHRMSETDNPRREEFAEKIGTVLKIVRSAGISLIMVTQLGDKDSVPTVIPRTARVRACLRVGAAISFRQIFGDLGEGAFARWGVFEFEQGTALMLSQEGAPLKVGAWHLESHHLRAIGKRALDLRANARTLTGQAAGQDTKIRASRPVDPRPLLRSVLDVIRSTDPTGGTEDDDVAWISELETVLTEHEDYRARSGRWLAEELRARQVRLEDVKRSVPRTDRDSGQRKELGVRGQVVRDRLLDLDG